MPQSPFIRFNFRSKQGCRGSPRSHRPPWCSCQGTWPPSQHVPGCSCSPKPASCHRATRRCWAPSAGDLAERARVSVSGELWLSVPGVPAHSHSEAGLEVGDTLCVPPGQTLFLHLISEKELLPPGATVPADMAQAVTRLCSVRPPEQAGGPWGRGVGSCPSRAPLNPPLAVNCGVSVLRSQKRTVVSPEPLARYLGEEEEAGSARGDTTAAAASPQAPTHSQTLVLSRGAEGYRDDSLGVPLQGAGAAGHRPHPEHRLRLVDDVQDLLCLHTLPCQGFLQRRHNLGIVDEEGQRHRLILGEKGQER